MKLVWIIAGVLIGLNTFGQCIEDLDNKNGFKEFTIGMSLAPVEKNLTFIKKLEDVETDLFKTKQDVIINGMTGGMELAFYKGKLVEIMIFFQQRNLEEFENLQHALTQLYGDPKNELADVTPIQLTNDKMVVWKGALTGLECVYEAKNSAIELIYWGLNETIEKTKEDL